MDVVARTRFAFAWKAGCAAVMALALAILCCLLPQLAAAEEGGAALRAGGASSGLAAQDAGDLQFIGLTGTGVSGNTVHLRDGDETTVTLSVKNNSGHDLEYVTMTDAPTYPQGDDEDDFEPIAFPPLSSYGDAYEDVTNASYDDWPYLTSETTGSRKSGFDIEAGATATFNLKISAGDLNTDTYEWKIQLGRQRFDFQKTYEDFNGYPFEVWENTGREVEEIYADQIPVTVVIYNQENAALSVGERTNEFGVPEITPPAGGVIDFGTIDLKTAGDDELVASRTMIALNTSPQNKMTDSYGNTTAITVGFTGEALFDGDSNWRINTPFTWGNGSLYDNNWSPLPPVTVSDNSVTYQTADYTVFLNAEHFIAGTYSGSLIVNTTPHKVLFNGEEGNATGQYRIPFTVTLTGENPRLLTAATNLAASPGNGYVELTWKPDSEADEYTEYTIYRREGDEDQTDPNELDWSLYEKVGTKQVGHDTDTMSYVDGSVQNGVTYSYTVMCGEPNCGYASATASATPDASSNSRLLAPEASAYGYANYVEVEWEMNEQYGGKGFDGAGMVDHFNIYRDGVLVDQIYQSAVVDTRTYYGEHEYNWVVNEPVPELYTPYSWQVSAVSPGGVEGFLSEESSDEAYSDKMVILGHEAWFDSRYYVYENLEEFDDVPAIAIKIDARLGYDSAEELTFWRSVGATAPDTSQAPYITVTGRHNTAYGSGVKFADKNVSAGQTYTYTVRALGSDGETSDFYTFTVKAVTSSSNDKCYFSSPVVTWSVVGGTSARLTFTAHDNITARVLRNGVDLNVSGYDDYWGHYFDVQDDPGADGTYTYRVEYTENNSGVVTAREFTFVRNTAPVDTSSLLTPPDAPTLSGRTSGDSNIILSWTPAATGGAPEGYHIYRTDAGEAQAGGRYVSVYHWSGYQDAWKDWGRGRYMSLAGADTLTFVDGRTSTSFYYKGNKYLGRIEDISWMEDSAPHEYWITAYNRVGESEPSRVVTFDSEDGNAPANLASEAPAAPTITRAWVDWEDISTRNYFDTYIGGRIRVAWKDSGLGGDIDSWMLTFSGLSREDNGLNGPYTESLMAYEAAIDPTTKLGTSANAPTCGISARSGENGELGRTVTVTVTAENGAGSAVSQEVPVSVVGLPRLRTVADNGGVLLEWTDLVDDATTQVTGWEVWRKAEYGLWERIADSSDTPEPGVYAGIEDNSYNHNLRYYAWRDNDAENGWTYQYKVVAKCADGVDRPSVAKKATPKRTAASEAPGAPQNLVASVVNGEVVLSWDEPATGGAVGTYYCYREGFWSGDSGYYWYSAGSVGGTSTSATWAPSEPGTYRMFVASSSSIDGQTVPDTKLGYQVDPDNWTNWTAEQNLAFLDQMQPTHSNVVSVDITQEQIDQQATESPAAPVLSATPGDGQITLNWTVNQKHLADGYSMPTYFEIERYTASGSRAGFDKVVVTATGSSWSYVDTSAEPGVRYRYTVTSCNNYNGGMYAEAYATATGITRDQKAAAQVEELIGNLPSVEDIQGVEDVDSDEFRGYEQQVVDVQEIYDSLTANQKSYVGAAATQALQETAATIAAKKYASVIGPVQTLIEALPGVAEIDAASEGELDDYGAQIAEARAAYKALPVEAKQGVNTAKLEAAEQALAQARQRIADQKAADAVTMQIEGLPEVDDLDDVDREAFESQRARVAAARAAYGKLTAAQKALVGQEALDKLAALEGQVIEITQAFADADAAAPVIAAIEALPDPRTEAFTLAAAGDVVTARAAYEGLTVAQQKLVDAAVPGKLAACEERVQQLKDELAHMEAAAAAGAVAGMIGAIPHIDDIDNMTLDDRPAVQEARDAYECLSDEAKDLLDSGTLGKLEAAEAKIAVLEALEVEQLIAKLPSPADMTLDDEAAVVAARTAFDALTEAQQGYLADAAQPKLEAAERRIAELKEEAADAARVDISAGKLTLSQTAFTYDGTEKEPDVVVEVGGKVLTAGTDYAVAYANNRNAGSSASVTVLGMGGYKGMLLETFAISKAANPLAAKAKAKTFKVKYKKLKKKAQKVDALAVSSAQGKLSYKIVKITAKKKLLKQAKKKIKMAADGKLALLKKLKKGTYTVQVRVSAAGNGNYLPASKVVTCKIRVK